MSGGCWPALRRHPGQPRSQPRRLGGSRQSVCHLKSKLLHFPSLPGHPSGGFSTRDEGVRARNAGCALALRAAEAITLRAHVTERLNDHGQQRPPIVMGDLTDEPLAATTQIAARPARLRDRHPRL
jgi:hypothetical protein